MQRDLFNKSGHTGFSEAPLLEIFDFDQPVDQSARYDVSNTMIGVLSRRNFAEVVLLVLVSGFAQTDRDALDLLGNRFLLINFQGCGNWRLGINETRPNLETVLQNLEVSRALAKDILLQPSGH